MKGHFNGGAWHLGRIGRRALALLLTLAPAAVMAGGCLDRPIEPLGPRTTLSIFERLKQTNISKIDLVLAIDNSQSMTDKQEILARAVPDLVIGLVNPRCVDAAGVPSAAQPEGPLEPCPVAGTQREFRPVTDIHIGIISSSLGGHGSGSCPAQDLVHCPNGVNTTNNDHGHLLSRTSACEGGSALTYNNKGFLAWDPEQKLSPPGTANVDALITSLREMVVGVGQIGCGYESQLESWYRFLVDPEPYATISAETGTAIPEGRDDELLAQRANFLRPDSLVAIIMLSDENDCSIREYGQYFYAAQLKNPNGTSYHLPAARAECAVDPNDPCCKSCSQDAGECPFDPTCYDENGGIRMLTSETDDAMLRCFDQKRRFGVDFLYPIDRYTTALSSKLVPNRAGELVPNPLFADLDPQDESAPARDPSMVFLAGIVGVPWQDIAVDKADLTKGLKTAAELRSVNEAGASTWDIILGDPEERVPPKDIFMVESIEPRVGTNPITGDATTTDCDPGNPINRCEIIRFQYACVFKLPEPVDCTDPSQPFCACNFGTKNDPLCSENPKTPGEHTLQTHAKAYPGLRELSALKGVGDQGIVASVCAKQLDDPEAADYGYRPAIGAIISRLKERLRGQCLARSLTADDAGQVPCVVIEATRVPDAGAAACNVCVEPGRQPVQPGHEGAVQKAQEDAACVDGQCNCFCEVKQLAGTDGEACQEELSSQPTSPATGEPVNGWCYVDATTTPATGNPSLVSACPATERRMIRFVGEDVAERSSTFFVTCIGDTSTLK
jgi:hypothetical protein